MRGGEKSSFSLFKKSVGGSSVQFSAPLLPLALLMLHIQKHLELVCVIRATVENYVRIENLSQKGRNPNYNLDTVQYTG